MRRLILALLLAVVVQSSSSSTQRKYFRATHAGTGEQQSSRRSLEATEEDSKLNTLLFDILNTHGGKQASAEIVKPRLATNHGLQSEIDEVTTPETAEGSTTEGSENQGEHGNNEADTHGEEGGGEEEGGTEEEGGSEEGEDHEAEEEESLEPMTKPWIILCATLTTIFIVLILFTIAFEKGKETLEESVDSTMRPMLHAMFSELTILGFLSVVTFFLNKVGFFTRLSVLIFGEQEEEALLENVEIIHYGLFFVMIIFLLQVSVVLFRSQGVHKEFHKMEILCTDSDRMEQIMERAKSGGTLGRADRELLEYSFLRKNFIEGRTLDPPFSPLPLQEQLPEDFEFGRYLSISFGKNGARIVEVSIKSWFAIIGGSILQFIIMIFCYPETIAWIWLGLGWTIVFSGLTLYLYLIHVRQGYLPELTQSPPWDEKVLPAWCNVDLEKYISKRSCLTKCFCKEEPNRQDTFFYMEKKGPKLHKSWLQLSIILMSIFAAGFFAMGMPIIQESYSTGLFAAYVVLGVVPILITIVGKHRVMCLMSLVESIGVRRNAKTIITVLREEKQTRIVRALLCLEQIHRFATQGFKPKAKKDRPKIDDHKVRLISKVYDAFDHDGSGALTFDEMVKLLEDFGAALDDDSKVGLENLFKVADLNEDGKIDKDEFIAWYSEYVGYDELSLKERARYLFELFDLDNSGKITIQETKVALEKLNLGFTLDEMAEIVVELDEDDDNEISEKEFEELLKKFYPPELRND